jgi:hypothetical protein
MAKKQIPNITAKCANGLYAVTTWMHSTSVNGAKMAKKFTRIQSTSAKTIHQGAVETGINYQTSTHAR